MSSNSFYDMSGVEDSLSAAQEAQVQQQTHQIMNVVKNLQPHESFMPHVISNILTEEQWNALDNHLKHHCVQLCIRAQIVCNKPKQSKAGTLGALYWGETFAHGKTAAEQNAINAAGQNRSVPAWDLITSSGFQGPADPRLSQLIYCFQHYANAARRGIRNPDLLQNPPTNSMSPDVPSRTGVLDQQTMNDLQTLLKTKMVQVGLNELHILGKIFGAKLLCSLKWASLDAQFDRLRAETIESLVAGNTSGYPGTKSVYNTADLIDQSLTSYNPNVLEILSAQQNAKLRNAYPQVYNLVGDIQRQRGIIPQTQGMQPNTRNPQFQPPKPINTIPLDPRRHGF